MILWKKKLRKWVDKGVFPKENARFVCGDEALFPFVVSRMVRGLDEPLVVVAPDGREAERFYEALLDCFSLSGDPVNVVYVPEISTRHRKEWVPTNEAAGCAALDAALRGEGKVYVGSAVSLTAPVAKPEDFEKREFILKVGATVSPDELTRNLVDIDYDNEFEVRIPGEFSKRGGILDVFSPLYRLPVRIEFFGDEVDTMRFFDPSTQRSVEPVDEVRVIPRGEAAVAPAVDDGTTFFTYLPEAPVAVITPFETREKLERFEEFEAESKWREVCEEQRRFYLLDYDADGWGEFPDVPVLDVEGGAVVEAFGPLFDEFGEGAAMIHWRQVKDACRGWVERGYSVTACCGSEGDMERLREILNEEEDSLAEAVSLLPMTLDSGVVLPSEMLIFLGTGDLFGRLRKTTLRRKRESGYKLEFAVGEDSELEPESYAVHASYGICLYHGIEIIETGARIQEVIRLEFADDAIIFVPLDQAHLVSRYAGGTRKLPSLSKIGGVSWKKAKEGALSSAMDYAAELLRLDAVRKYSEGFSFRDQVEWERLFVDAFPFHETEDQQRAIDETLRDMEAEEPMDRLLCGDVGYGKTEVAMRAAFRAVMNGKQVAVLAPTTVLVQQHYMTFKERMAEYPIVIDSLSRFQTKKQQRDVIERVAVGGTDIVVGTHRLLQRDVSFNDLGLVVIDEEQRFGVKHKDRLKRMRTSVDILTMTATPIPRTLYFSISGIRNLSTIMTPPAERLPVKTIVAQYDKKVIRDAVLGEIEREGQVFFLHNRVNTIYKICASLEEIVPEARFIVGHGQMSSNELENVMVKFVEGKVDVLVSTTIIESGLDIPNANTILIDRADRFGLSELYQLRGRVGRSNRQAYAYLLLPPMAMMPTTARERIAAVRKYTHLGAGFKLALKDLEIRGAGNILGTEQSGQIAAVGFELYCELLREAVNRLSNKEPEPPAAGIDIHLDFVEYGIAENSRKLSLSIPRHYINDEAIRIETYKRLNRVKKENEVDALEEELRDRFGSVPEPTIPLLEIARLRALACQLKLSGLTVRNRSVLLEGGGGIVKRRFGKSPKLSSSEPFDQFEELKQLLRSLK